MWNPVALTQLAQTALDSLDTNLNTVSCFPWA